MRTPLLVLLALPATAWCSEDPWLRLELGAAYAVYNDTQDRHHGLATAVDLAFAPDGFWIVRGGYQLGDHRTKGDVFQVHQLSLGVRYQLDVFAYVPWIEVSPTLSLGSGEGGPAGAGFAVGVGADRLLDERWSVGVGGHLHSIFGGAPFPSYTTVGLRVGYRWAWGDPFAP
jgi:hypothetical protein